MEAIKFSADLHKIVDSILAFPGAAVFCPVYPYICLMGHNILNWIINLLQLYLFSCHLLHSQKLPDGAIIGLPDVQPGGGMVVGVCMACVGQPQVRQVRGSSSEEAAGAGSKHAH